ncbi:PIG-L family deacetylase [Candidatus Bipolaricaulota bacterium]|nr:PIG-L family deacetylase [Candidatus Bipolaricaulota bacterium]
MDKRVEATQGERALVFAPHNDDEILAAGGLIQRYVESDTQVKVAVVTNGDGQIRRPPFLPFLRADFVKLGYKRQNETLDAMDYLGLSEDDVEFFGYPDRGLSHMWTNHWDLNEPYYSKYTKTDHSPYDNSYTGEAPYCGSAVAEDVRRLLLEYKPDVIYLPHPNDSHPDHWATNGFILYGLEQLKNEGYDDFTDVTMLSYLVHSVRFPWPRGKYLESSLSEPEHLEELDTEWVEVELDMKERLRKFRAIGKYRTQTQLMRKYLISFARANELFGIVPSLSLNNSIEYEGKSNLSRDFILNEQEDEPLLSYLNPKRRSRIATLRRYPDMKSVSLTRNSENLNLSIDFFNKYRPGNEIQITVKPFSRDGNRSGVGGSHSFRFLKRRLYHNQSKIEKGNGYDFESGSKSYGLSIPLENINDPSKLILSITLARKGVPFARSANRLVKIH